MSVYYVYNKAQPKKKDNVFRAERPLVAASTAAALIDGDQRRFISPASPARVRKYVCTYVHTSLSVYI